MPGPETHRPTQRGAHLVGGGIAALAAAVFLIRDGGWRGDAIQIYEAQPRLGGSLDADGDAVSGYVMRGQRMFSYEAYTCTLDLLSSIPSLGDPKLSVADEIYRFNEAHPFHPSCRLVKGGRRADETQLGLSLADHLALLAVMATPERLLGRRRIQDVVPATFFETVFWIRFCTSFAFQPWHSAAEFRRYLFRFVHEFRRLRRAVGVRRAPQNENDSIVRPLRAWLDSQGVRFNVGAEVVGLDWRDTARGASVSRLHVRRGGEAGAVDLSDGELVLVTNGSMTAASALGSMTAAPTTMPARRGPAWSLWETLAAGRAGFGHPEVFTHDVGRSRWVSFTATLKDPLFFSLMESFTGDAAGAGGLVTFVDSPWRLSVLLPHQPCFADQDPGASVFWGYGLAVDRPGRAVNKAMTDCSGEELMVELLSHLPFADHRAAILESATCIPCEMPYVTSQFMPRLRHDRPPVLPPGVRDFAFIGQFCELPDDVVFTVEYSVRSARVAVQGLLGLNTTIPPVYKGHLDPGVVLESLRALSS